MIMKNAILICIILMASIVIEVSAQTKGNDVVHNKVTVKSQMETLHNRFGVNFIYDSSMNLEVPCNDAKLDHIKNLELYLKYILEGTEIDFRIRTTHVILKQRKHEPDEYTIFVEEQMDTLDESKITAYITQHHNATQTGLKHIDGSRFRKGFAAFSSPDLIKEIQNLTGVTSGTELLSGMYVHGGDGTDNLFLLDGVPIYQVSHFAGLVSAFNTEMIDNLDFYKSGFPSRFGGKLSSVTDITTREGDMNQYHGSFNIGLLNGGMQLEGPVIKGKSSFNVGVRRSWYDILTIPGIEIHNLGLPYGERDILRYAMTDINASMTHRFSRYNRISFNFYTGTDIIRYGHEETSVKYWEGTRYTGKNKHDISVRWGNILASVNWKRDFSEKLRLNVVTYYTRANNRVKFSRSRWEMSIEEPLISEALVNEMNKGTLHDAGIKGDLFGAAGGRHKIRTGMSFVMHMFRPYRQTTAVSYAQGGISTNQSAIEEEIFDHSYDSPEVSMYLEDEIVLTDRMKTNIGLRYVLFGTESGAKHSLEPRAALSIELSPKASFKVSYSEMRQFIHNMSPHYVDSPMSVWFPSTDRIPPMHSKEIAAGLYTRLPANIIFNIEGFWKKMDNLTEYCGTGSIYPDIASWEYDLVRGEGRSYGAEAELSWKGKKTEISACYTLSWSKRFFNSIWYDWYPARNDNRHKLTVNAAIRFSRSFDMQFGWVCHSGNRMTVPTQAIDGQLYYSNPYNYKLPAYHRLDLGFNFRKQTKRGNESIWNISIYNAYCRMNPLFIEFSRHETEVQKGKTWENELKTISVIPIIPSFSYTLRF